MRGWTRLLSSRSGLGDIKQLIAQNVNNNHERSLIQTKKLTEMYFGNEKALRSEKVICGDHLYRLSNGIRVTTDPNPGSFIVAGILINAGSKDEAINESGAAYILEKLAFNDPEVHGQLFKLGGQLSCTSSRDSIIYSSTLFSKNDLFQLFSLLKKIIFNPEPSETHIVNCNDIQKFELLQMKEKPESLMNELCHAMMFGCSSLGSSPIIYGPTYNDFLIENNSSKNSINIESLMNFKNRIIQPENLIVGASGVPLNDLIDVAERVFGDVPENLIKSNQDNNSYHNYYGGPLYIEDKRFLDNSFNISNANLYQDHSHFFFGFPCSPSWHKDIYTIAICSTLLGGGSSFSAGGPGKGLFTRFYSNLLNRYYFIESMHSTEANYSQGGYIGVIGSCTKGYLTKALSLALREIHRFNVFQNNEYGIIEFNRAKNMVKSTLLMGLESRISQFETVMKNVALLNRFISKEELLEGIDNVTINDLAELKNKLFDSSIMPTLIVMGENISDAPTFNNFLQINESLK